MNPYLQAFLIVLAIGVSVFAAGALIGTIWFGMQRKHHADQASGGELDIPEERDFLDADYTPCAPSENSTPHDADYDTAPAKRF
jgi:hypothetical protein